MIGNQSVEFERLTREIQSLQKKLEEESRKNNDFESLMTKFMDENHKLNQEISSKTLQIENLQKLTEKCYLWFESQKISKPPFLELHFKKKNLTIETLKQNNPRPSSAIKTNTPEIQRAIIHAKTTIVGSSMLKQTRMCPPSQEESQIKSTITLRDLSFVVKNE